MLFKKKNETKVKVLELALNYTPAVSLKVVNFLFRIVFQKLQYIENYNHERALFLLLIRFVNLLLFGLA